MGSPTLVKTIEDVTGKSLPMIDDLKWNSWGYKLRNDVIEGISLYGTELNSLPDELWEQKHLRQLSLIHTQLTDLPDRFANLSRLEALYLGGNRYTHLPESISTLSNLKYLYIYEKSISSIPSSYAQLSNLEELSTLHSIEIPAEIQILGQSGCKITQIDL